MMIHWTFMDFMALGPKRLEEECRGAGGLFGAPMRLIGGDETPIPEVISGLATCNVLKKSQSGLLIGRETTGLIG